MLQFSHQIVGGKHYWILNLCQISFITHAKMENTFHIYAWGYKLWYPMWSYYLLDKQWANISSIIHHLTSYQRNHFWKSINYHQNWVKSSFKDWKSYDEIHAYILPNGLRNWKRRVRACILRTTLSTLAFRTTLHMFGCLFL